MFGRKLLSSARLLIGRSFSASAPCSKNMVLVDGVRTPFLMSNKNAMMGDTIVVPVNQPKQCCICMDETKTIVPHPCKICSENSWTVCKDCSQKLDMAI